MGHHSGQEAVQEMQLAFILCKCVSSFAIREIQPVISSFLGRQCTLHYRCWYRKRIPVGYP